MKTNEAPEKIYLTSDEKNSYVFTQKRSDSMGIEYTRTDPFIEKVYTWLKNYAFVDDNKSVNLPILLHDFLKDSRKF